MRKRVGRKLDGDAGGLEHLYEQQPDWPAAEAAALVPGPPPPRSAACSATPSGSSNGAALFGIESGTGCTRPSGQASCIPKPTVGRAVACELHLAAEMAVPCPAGRAAPAGNRGIDHRRARRGPATARHRAGELVAEDKGPLEHCVADTSLEEPMPVRSRKDRHRRPLRAPRPAAAPGRLLVRRSSPGRVQPQRPHAG